MMSIYDQRAVAPHGDTSGPSVFLMNEAPGPSEAASGVPLYGQQGANIFHTFRDTGILWALDHPEFVWPTKDLPPTSKRHRDQAAFLKRCRYKAAFLVTRAHHVTCTNAYPYWPRPADGSKNFCAPADNDVLSPDNVARIRKEVASSHRIILICGRSAYLACLGKDLPHPASRERTELTAAELRELNNRMSSHFENGWYMGHTGRWNFELKLSETIQTLRLIASLAGWPLSANVG